MNHFPSKRLCECAHVLRVRVDATAFPGMRDHGGPVFGVFGSSMQAVTSNVQFHLVRKCWKGISSIDIGVCLEFLDLTATSGPYLH